MKSIFIILFFCIFFTLGSCISENEKENNQLEGSLELLIGAVGEKILNNQDVKSVDFSVGMDRLKIEDAISFSKKQNLDTNFAIFIDMSIHSGKKRFFVVDIQNNKIIHSGLCCHGMGMGSTCTSPEFSNEKGSYCTSLGKYKTGKRSYSNWGINIHYKMHGLERTNNNAFSRTIVLHSYDPVSHEEIFPEHLPLGWSQGCPVISNKLMTSMDTLLQSRKKPLLLWIYN